MLALFGALFLIGLGTVAVASVTACGEIGILQVLKYGSLWVLVPGFVFLVSGDKYMTTLSIWIPTFFVVRQLISACSQPPEEEEECVDE